MRKAYSILITFIALAEFIYIMNTGGFTAARSARFSVPSSTVRPYYSSTKSPAATRSPTARPTQRPAATPKPAVTYIANTSTGKFHRPSCASVKQMYASHRKEFYCTRQEMIAMGYSPCQRCHP